MNKHIKYDYQRLKGRIKEYYNNQEDFAKVLGISSVSLSNKLNNKNYFSYRELDMIVEILGIKDEEIKDIFFKQKVSKKLT